MDAIQFSQILEPSLALARTGFSFDRAISLRSRQKCDDRGVKQRLAAIKRTGWLDSKPSMTEVSPVGEAAGAF